MLQKYEEVLRNDLDSFEVYDPDSVEVQYVNDIRDLPYLSADLISVNEKTVLKGTMPWLVECIQSRIDKATLDS